MGKGRWFWAGLVVAAGLAGGLWAGARLGQESTPPGGTAATWRSAVSELLQPLAGQLAEVVEGIPVYLPAALPGEEGGGEGGVHWSAFADAAPDRYGLTLVQTDRPLPPNDPALRSMPERWVAHVAGGPPGSLLLQPPRLESRAAPVDLGRGITGYRRSCGPGAPGCPLTLLVWRTGGWSYHVWTPATGQGAESAVTAAARGVVSALPAFLNPVRADSAGYMAVQLREGRQETGILWFHPEADLFVGHRQRAVAAMELAAQLEQVD